MKSLVALLAASAMVLSACGGPYSGGSGGYKIRARDTVKIQTRALESVNSSRMSGGLTAVQLNPQLSSAAAVHSRDMAAQNRPWHFGSDGSSPLDRVARSGYYGKMLGENISESKHRIEQTMDTLVKAFETQLDKLFASDALDVSTDIDVMENMLRADGLTGDTPFKL